MIYDYILNKLEVYSKKTWPRDTFYSRSLLFWILTYLEFSVDPPLCTNVCVWKGCRHQNNYDTGPDMHVVAALSAFVCSNACAQQQKVI